MARRAPLAPRLSAVLAVTGVAVVAVLIAGAITGSGPGDDRSRLDTDDVSAPATTTSSTTTTEAEVLGVVVERSPVAPVASVPPATTEVPVTEAPTTTTTTAAPAPTAAPTTSTTMAPPPPPPPPPAPTTATVALTARGDGSVDVVLTGPDGSREISFGPGGGSTRIEGLTPGNHQLFARVEGSAPPPGDDGTQVGGGVTMVPSDVVSIGAGQTLSATFDGARWTLVLA
jgi:hypothetical protein